MPTLPSSIGFTRSPNVRTWPHLRWPLAWVLAQGEDIVPIPGTTRRANLERNVVALQVTLSEQEFAAIEDVAPRGVAAGERYPAPMMTQVNR